MKLINHIRPFLILILLPPLALNVLADYFPNSENWDISSPEAQGVNCLLYTSDAADE